MRPRSASRLLAPVVVVTTAVGLAVSCAVPAGHEGPTSSAAVAAPAAASGETAVVVAPAAPTPRSWNLAWRAEDTFPGVTDTTTTCRFSARLTADGDALRAEFGSTGAGRGYPLISASVARPVAPHSLEVAEGSSVPLTFAGSPGVDVAARASVLSDPVALPVRAGEDVLVTVTAGAGDAYVKGGLNEPGACSAGPVDAPATASPDALTEAGNVRWLHSLLVEGTDARSVVALGDSLTEGPSSATYAYERWSDHLDEPGVAVVNAGVGGNAISRPGLYFTVDGVTRARALLAEPGVDDVVLLLGTNDLGLGQSADEVLGAIDEVADAAQAAGVQLWVGTLLPRGAGRGTQLEQSRQAVNASLLDGRLTERGVRVIDTASAVADPDRPRHLLGAYDAGDHLHVNADGARALGLVVRQSMGLGAQTNL